MKKPQHGGERKGAGRKPAPLKMVSFRISVHPEVHRWFVEEAHRRGVSVSSVYVEAAAKFHDDWTRGYM